MARTGRLDYTVRTCLPLPTSEVCSFALEDTPGAWRTSIVSPTKRSRMRSVLMFESPPSAEASASEVLAVA